MVLIMWLGETVHQKSIIEYFRFKELFRYIYHYPESYQNFRRINIHIYTNTYTIHFKIYGMRNKHSNYVYQLAGGKIQTMMMRIISWFQEQVDFPVPCASTCNMYIFLIVYFLKTMHISILCLFIFAVRIIVCPVCVKKVKAIRLSEVCNMCLEV